MLLLWANFSLWIYKNDPCVFLVKIQDKFIAAERSSKIKFIIIFIIPGSPSSRQSGSLNCARLSCCLHLPHPRRFGTWNLLLLSNWPERNRPPLLAHRRLQWTCGSWGIWFSSSKVNSLFWLVWLGMAEGGWINSGKNTAKCISFLCLFFSYRRY